MQWSWQLHVWQQYWLWLQLAFCYFTFVQLQGREKDTAGGVRKPSWLNRTQHLRPVNKNSMQSLSLRGTIGQAVQCDTNLRPTFVVICGPVLVTTPGAPLTYFNDGGVRRIFLGLTFWPKGIFLGLWKTPGFFWVAKTTQGFFGVLYFSSAQINNNISAIYCLCGITGYFWDCNLCEK